MKCLLRFYDERRNLIGKDECEAPPGTSYVTIGMEVSPSGPPASGYQLTGDEAAEVLQASEKRTQAHQWYHSGVPVGPAPGQPIFGHDGREIAGEYHPDMRPLTSFCRCGRQVTMDSSGWEHSD